MAFSRVRSEILSSLFFVLASLMPSTILSLIREFFKVLNSHVSLIFLNTVTYWLIVSPLSWAHEKNFYFVTNVFLSSQCPSNFFKTLSICFSSPSASHNSSGAFSPSSSPRLLLHLRFLGTCAFPGSGFRLSDSAFCLRCKTSLFTFRSSFLTLCKNLH